MWRNVIRTIEVLGHEKKPPPPLAVHLRCDDRHWVRQPWAQPLFPQSIRPPYSYNLLVLPLATIPDLRDMKVVPDSENLKQQMHWEQIDWAVNLVSKTNAEDEQSVRAALDAIQHLHQIITETHGSIMMCCTGYTRGQARGTINADVVSQTKMGYLKIPFYKPDDG
jgi:hypothetical protein